MSAVTCLLSVEMSAAGTCLLASGGVAGVSGGDCGDGLFLSGGVEVCGRGDCLMSICEAGGGGGGGWPVSNEGEAAPCSGFGTSVSFPSPIFTALSSSLSSFFLLNGCPVE